MYIYVYIYMYIYINKIYKRADVSLGYSCNSSDGTVHVCSSQSCDDPSLIGANPYWHLPTLSSRQLVWTSLPGKSLTYLHNLSSKDSKAMPWACECMRACHEPTTCHSSTSLDLVTWSGSDRVAGRASNEPTRCSKACTTVQYTSLYSLWQGSCGKMERWSSESVQESKWSWNGLERCEISWNAFVSAEPSLLPAPGSQALQPHGNL